MKYFEFVGFEYYALIQARDEFDALRQYEADVAEIEDNQIGMVPTEISKDEVIIRLRQCSKNDLEIDLDFMLRLIEKDETHTLLIDIDLC